MVREIYRKVRLVCGWDSESTLGCPHLLVLCQSCFLTGLSLSQLNMTNRAWVSITLTLGCRPLLSTVILDWGVVTVLCKLFCVCVIFGTWRALGDVAWVEVFCMVLRYLWDLVVDTQVFIVDWTTCGGSTTSATNVVSFLRNSLSARNNFALFLPTDRIRLLGSYWLWRCNTGLWRNLYWTYLLLRCVQTITFVNFSHKLIWLTNFLSLTVLRLSSWGFALNARSSSLLRTSPLSPTNTWSSLTNRRSRGSRSCMIWSSSSRITLAYLGMCWMPNRLLLKALALWERGWYFYTSWRC